MASVAAAAILRTAVVAFWCATSTAGVHLTPQEAAKRRPGDFAPARLKERAVVRGRVVTRSIRVLDHFEQTGIEQDGYGLVLESRDGLLKPLEPGDVVEATGEIAMRAGLPVLKVSKVRVVGRSPAPEPVAIPLEALQGFRHLGRLVMTEGRVLEAGENTAGAVLLLGDRERPYRLFLPHAQEPGASFAGFRCGDTVRVTGLASQYCVGAPYTRWFQLTTAGSSGVVLAGRALLLPPMAIFAVMAGLLAFGATWWTRERRLRAQREALRRSHGLAEEILGASSIEDIRRRAAAVAPAIFGVTDVRLYLYNAGSRTLEQVPDGEGEAPVIAPASPRGGAESAVAACFQNRTALAVPDSSRSPFPPPEEDAPAMPRAVLFVPMFAQGETVGVLELAHRHRARVFTHDEQALAQHLANQMGAAVKLLDQRSVREQLFRTEKLAAVGRLISGVVNEMRAPLASICNLAETMAAQKTPPRSEQIRAISAEAQKASEMVARLVSFASNEPVKARPVDLNRLLRKMAEFREREWKARGIRVRATIADEPLPVRGSDGQLEQVFLDLLVHAEQALQESAEKTISLRTMRLAHRVLVEIGYSGGHGPEPDAAANLGLGVCRSIIAGHGGELRTIFGASGDPRFEIELPRAELERGRAPAGEPGPSESSQTRTALLIEPDETVEQHLHTLLAARGYRVVPVRSADAGLDLAQRLRFDAVFCSVRAPGLNWVELSESLDTRVGVFVLLSDGYDPELAAGFEGESRSVLAKPIDDHNLGRALERLESRLGNWAAAG